MDNDNAPFVRIGGYDIISFYARKEMKHGGVCVIVKLEIRTRLSVISLI